MKKTFVIAVAATTLLSVQLAAQDPTQDARAVIDAAAAAMGATSLQSIRYTGTGSTNPTGQAFMTGGPWPRFTVTKYTMLVNYTVPAMRQELVRIDDQNPPRGGGAGGYNPTRARAASGRSRATSSRTRPSMDGRRSARSTSG